MSNSYLDLSNISLAPAHYPNNYLVFCLKHDSVIYSSYSHLFVSYQGIEFLWNIFLNLPVFSLTFFSIACLLTIHRKISVNIMMIFSPFSLLCVKICVCADILLLLLLSFGPHWSCWLYITILFSFCSYINIGWCLAVSVFPMCILCFNPWIVYENNYWNYYELKCLMRQLEKNAKIKTTTTNRND